MPGKTDEKKIQMVAQSLNSGVSKGDIVANLSKKWECSERTIYRLIEVVESRWVADTDEDIEKAKARSKARWFFLMRESVKTGAWNAYAKACIALDKIDGIYAPTEMKVSGQIKLVEVSDEILPEE